jgi:glycosyl hydrolase family 25
MPGLGVDLHPVYQRGTNALPDVEYGWLKLADGAAVYRTPADALAKLFRDRGLPFGGYEFAQPGTNGAKAFDVLWAECRRIGATGVAPAVDIEGPGWSPATAAQRGKAFCARARAVGVRPAIYMDLSLLQATRPDLWAEKPVIWAPRYGAKPEAGARYTGHYDVHQFSSSGTLPGSAGAVDWNQAYTNAHLLGTTEEDMALTQADAGVLFWGTPFDGNDNFAQYLKSHVAKLEAGQTAVLAAVQAATKDPAITLDAMRQLVNDAIEQHVQITGTVEIGPKP